MNQKRVLSNSNYLLTTEEAAQELRVSPRTLSKWRSTGENNITFVKVGKAVRYRSVDIQGYIERNLKGANS